MSEYHKGQVRLTPRQYKRKQYTQLADIVAKADMTLDEAHQLMAIGVSRNLVFGKIPAWLMVLVRFISLGDGYSDD